MGEALRGPGAVGDPRGEPETGAAIRDFVDDTRRRLRAEGKPRGMRLLLLEQLRRRFGHDVPDAARARIQAAGIEDLERWAVRVVDPETRAEAPFGSEAGSEGGVARFDCQKWYVEWEQKAREEGRSEGTRELLLIQLRHRFGSLPESSIAAIRIMRTELIELWAIRALTAKTLDEVFERRQAAPQ